MKHFFYWLFPLTALFLSSTTIYSQNAYAKFSQIPSKRINSTNIEGTDFYIEYFSRKKATLLIELTKDGKSYAYANQTVKSKGKAFTKLNISKKAGSKITPGSGYSLRLRLFEGDKNNLKGLLSETVTKNISLTRLLYTKL